MAGNSLALPIPPGTCLHPICPLYPQPGPRGNLQDRRARAAGPARVRQQVAALFATAQAGLPGPGMRGLPGLRGRAGLRGGAASTGRTYRRLRTSATTAMPP
jgi:hypothetical protein